MTTAVNEFTGKVAFALGTGRCGTHFLSQVMTHEPDVAAAHERNRLNETFQRYCQWYNLPVDNGGFLFAKEQEISADLCQNKFSFEASAYLSCSALELYERFGAKFVLMVRRPEAVVNSYCSKGWYQTNPIYMDADKALGFNWYTESHPHHIFSRLAPSGPDRNRWLGLSQVGKLAWYWNALNTAVLTQFAQIPSTHWKIVKLEELSYATYQEVMTFLGWPSQVSAEKYQQIAQQRPGSRESKQTIANWSQTEASEFETEVEPMALQLNYPFRYHDLPQPDFRATQKPNSFTHSLKRTRTRAKQWAFQKFFLEEK